MSKRAEVYFKDRFAGMLEKESSGKYLFTYNKDYLAAGHAMPVSATLPLSDGSYESETLFSFFHGLIPEGWLLELESKALKIDEHDAFEMLLAACNDCVGAVSIRRVEE